MRSFSKDDDEELPKQGVRLRTGLGEDLACPPSIVGARSFGRERLGLRVLPLRVDEVDEVDVHRSEGL